MYTIRKKGKAALGIMVDTNLIRSSVFRVGLQDRFKQYHRMHTHQVTAYYYNLYNIDVVFTIFLLQILVSFVIIRCLISYILCAPLISPLEKNIRTIDTIHSSIIISLLL